MGDLISRQDAINAICNQCSMTIAGDRCTNSFCKDVRVILELPSTQQWIPCSERLPEKDDLYLVCGEDKVWLCEFMHIGFVRGWVNGAANPIVIAWMPRPDSYEEVER